MIIKFDVAKANAVAAGLLDELEAVCSHGNALAILGEAIGSHDVADSGAIEEQLQEVWQQVTSLPSRIDCMHKLATTMQVLAALDTPAKPAAKTRRR